MIEPKTFYRKLDSLLSKIWLDKSDSDFIFRIVKELELTFGEDLGIGDGRVYEERENDYFLIWSSSSTHKIAQKIPSDSEALNALLQSKTYIFDNPSLTIDKNINEQGEYKIPAAITVRSPEHRWIIVFELRSNWIREEIELCLNAVRTYINYRIDTEAIKSEKQQAAHIQQSLLPSQAPEVKDFKIAGFSQPAEIVGGDLFDFYNFDDEVLGVCIGDASGHGLSAALLVRDVVTGLRMGLEKHMKMAYTFKKLNKVIYRSVYSTNFISLFYAEIEKNGNILFVNAGHPAPLLFSENKISELNSTGLVLGALPEIELHRGYAHMNPNDLLVLFTDGIIERKNSKSSNFGIEGIKDVILKNKNERPQKIIEAVFNTAKSFGNNKKWEDDATVVVIKKEV
ncbi:PP2C family protein-serine/threonine phosphatase [Melioribacteraceae bacterium 4301-Me]|uniref:PP2C family protein-serine/threonine phosphatase n=1 Tax=Pyranulibacter aquaticus TaxID=3163344 RepID=UPI00359804A5